ncbi:hypothetical protein SAMN05192558_119105, partial [Actinokineospora alba]
RPGPTQPSPTQPNPAQPDPAQPNPAQPAPPRPTPPRPTQPSPTQPSPTQPSPTRPGPAQPGPAQPGPASAAQPDQPIPSWSAPVRRRTTSAKVSLGPNRPDLAQSHTPPPGVHPAPFPARFGDSPTDPWQAVHPFNRSPLRLKPRHVRIQRASKVRCGYRPIGKLGQRSRGSPVLRVLLADGAPTCRSSHTVRCQLPTSALTVCTPRPSPPTLSSHSGSVPRSILQPRTRHPADSHPRLTNRSAFSTRRRALVAPSFAPRLAAAAGVQQGLHRCAPIGGI